MKKEYTINELVTINETMGKVANAGLTGKVAYLAYRNLSKLAKIASDYDKVRNELIQKYGEADPEVEGQMVVKRESENYPKFVEELTEVLSQTEEIDLYKIPEEAMDKIAEAEGLNVSDFAIIDNYLVDRPEEPKVEEVTEEEAPTEE